MGGGRIARRFGALFVACFLGIALASCGGQPPSPEAQAALPACLGGEDGRAAIEACDAIIEAGKGGARFLSVAYLARATHETRLERFYHAIADYSAVLELMPDFAAARLARANLYQRTAQYARSFAEFERLIASTADNAGLKNELAWYLATCPAPAYRDGPKAVALALDATLAQPNFATIDTMAAAYAAAGEYAKAAHEQRIAILALGASSPADQEAYTVEFYDRLSLYVAGKPYTLTFDEIRHAPVPDLTGDIEALLAAGG